MHDEHELELEAVPVNRGGRPLRGFLPGIHRETVIDGSAATAGGGDGGAGAGEAALAGGATAGAAASADTDVVAPAPSDAGIDFSDPAVIERLASHPQFLEFVDDRAAGLASTIVDQRLGGLEQLLQQFGDGDPAAAGQAAPAGELNPWDPGFGQGLDARFQSLEQKLLAAVDRLGGAFASREQQEQSAKGEQRLKDILADDVARNGEFPRAPGATESKAEQLVTPLARMLFPQVQERFGTSPRAAEIAMSRAAGIVREIIAEARTAADNAEQNRLAVLSGGPQEPGATVTGIQTAGDIQARNIEEGLSAVTARHRDALRAAR